MYLLHHLLKPNPGYRRLAAWLEAAPRLRNLFTAAEKGAKTELFGCRVTAVERASSQDRAGDLLRLQLPIDHRLWGESSWIRYWQGRDEDLWTETRAT